MLTEDQWADVARDADAKRANELFIQFALHADIPWNAVMETLRIAGAKPEEITLNRLATVRAQYAFVQAAAMMKERKKWKYENGQFTFDPPKDT